MLRVFMMVQGTHEPLEVSVRPSGQNLVAAVSGAGRKAHFWWDLEGLEQNDPQAAAALRMLAPNLDRVWVGRETVPGQQQLQTVFDGNVVECGFDPTMLSVTAMEPARRPTPQQPPEGGVREPLRPMPTGGPQGAVPPGGQPQPVGSPLPVPGEAPAVPGNLLTQGLFVRGRESVGAAQTG